MKVLITGISGFLGSHVAAALAPDFEIIGLYKSNVPSVHQTVEVFSNLADVPEVDAVVMCHAAVSSGSHSADNQVLFDANVQQTQQIVSKFPNAFLIYVSTVGVFGNPAVVINEKSPVNPINEYAATKLAGEKCVSEAAHHAIIRLSSLYGIGMKENTLIPNYVNQALENGKIEVWGNGARLQNYVWANDICQLIRQILEQKPTALFPYLGVSDKEYSNLEIATKIAGLTQSQIVFVNQDSSASLQFDNALTRKAVNWSPQTTIEQGLSAYIEWKKKQF